MSKGKHDRRRRSRERRSRPKRRKRCFAAGDLVVYPTHGVGKILGIETPGNRRLYAQRLRRPFRQGPHDPARSGRQGQEFGPAAALDPEGNGRGADQAQGPLARQAHDVEPPRPGIRGQDQFGRSRLHRRGGARPLSQCRPARAVLQRAPDLPGGARPAGARVRRRREDRRADGDRAASSRCSARPEPAAAAVGGRRSSLRFRHLWPAAAAAPGVGRGRHPWRGAACSSRCTRTSPRRLDRGDRLVYLGDYLGYGRRRRRRRSTRCSPSAAPCSAAATGLPRRYRRSCAAARKRCGRSCWSCNSRPIRARCWAGCSSTASPRRSRPMASIARAGLAAARDGVLALTRWTAHAPQRRSTARPGHRQLFTALAPRRLHRGGRRCSSSMPASIRRSRSICKATYSGGAVGDVLELEAPFAGFRRVVLRRAPPPRRHRRDRATPLRSTAAAGQGGPLCAACFAPDGKLVDRIEA